MLPKKAYLEFQKIYEKNFGREISYENAKKRADELFGYASAIYKGLERQHGYKKNKTSLYIEMGKTGIKNRSRCNFRFNFQN